MKPWCNIPNILTYSRILTIPLLVLCFEVSDTDGARWTSLAIFIVAGITDYFDGYLARIWKQQSILGRMLDPIADKLLVAICLLILVDIRTLSGIHILPASVILAREILVSGMREFLSELKVSLPVTYLAKLKTTMQLVAIGFLILGPTGDKIFSLTTGIGLCFLWMSALLTLYTGSDYFRAGLRHAIK